MLPPINFLSASFSAFTIYNEVPGHFIRYFQTCFGRQDYLHDKIQTDSVWKELPPGHEGTIHRFLLSLYDLVILAGLQLGEDGQ
jgi:hypothetical protein